MKLFKKLFIISFLFISIHQSTRAEIPYFLDFKYILNNSDAGKKAQGELKKKLDNGMKNLSQTEKNLQSEEKKIIEQKKILTPEDYKKKVSSLREKVSKLQKDRNKLLGDIAKQRQKARSELLKNLNPVIKEYMQEKKIRFVMDKKSLILADENLDITNDIIKLLNARLKSIKLN